VEPVDERTRRVFWRADLPGELAEECAAGTRHAGSVAHSHSDSDLNPHGIANGHVDSCTVRDAHSQDAGLQHADGRRIRNRYGGCHKHSHRNTDSDSDINSGARKRDGDCDCIQHALVNGDQQSNAYLHKYRDADKDRHPDRDEHLGAHGERHINLYSDGDPDGNWDCDTYINPNRNFDGHADRVPDQHLNDPSRNLGR
jgi:hypothetical protein